MKYTSVALNPLQKAYWLGKGKEIQWGRCSCQAVFELVMKDLDELRFKEALEKLIATQPYLLGEVNESMEMVFPKGEGVEDFISFYELSETDQEELVQHMKKEMKYSSFSEGEKLIEIRVLRRPQGSYSILVRIDMVLLDLRSMHLFFQQLSDAYHGRQLQELHYCYQDYANELLEAQDSPDYEQHKAYWEKQAMNFPGPPDFPVGDLTKEENKEFFKRRQFVIEQKEWEIFCRRSAKAGLSPSVAILSLYAQILSAWGGGKEFGLAVTVAHRKALHPDISCAMGEFTKVLLLALEFTGEAVGIHANKMQERLWENLKHLDYDALAFRKSIYEKTGESRIYPFVFTSGLGNGKPSKDSFQEKIRWVESTTPQVILDHQVFPHCGGAILAWDCRDAAFYSGVPEEMFRRYQELVLRSIQEEDFWENSLVDFRSKESIEVQKSVNKTTRALPLCRLHEPLWEQAKERPDATAILYKERAYSYKELVEKAHGVIHLLEEKGIRPGSRILVAMENSFETLGVILGILGHGCSYVPVLHHVPKERIKLIYERAGAVGIFAGESMSDLGYPLFTSPPAREQARLYQGKVSDEAYVIFTSGSTGTPKGVMITHEAAMNTILDVNRRNQISEKDKVLALSSLSFDLSVYDIFGLLGCGGVVVIATEEEKIDPSLIHQLCVKHQVSLWNTVPKYFEIYADYLVSKEESNPWIRHVFLSGDWIPLRIVQLIKDHFPEAHLISMGGATEASIWSNYYEVNKLKEHWKSIPYGYPLANQRFYVFDELGRPCPQHVPGLLHIAGDGLALGYAGEKELTEKAFYFHPYVKERVYYTGDYGRYDQEGVLEFLGRKDQQIKISGYRIELGEIEKAFRLCGIEEFVVMPLGSKQNRKKLVAFVRLPFSKEELREKLEAILPKYSIPDPIYGIVEIPKTVNNKVDRKKLEALASSAETQGKQEEDHELFHVIKKCLKLPVVNISDGFSNLGVSSMELIALANELESHFGHRPTVGEMMSYTSLAELLAYYQSSQEKVPVEKEEEVDALSKEELSSVAKTMSYGKLERWIQEGSFLEEEERILREELESREKGEEHHPVLQFLADTLGLGNIETGDNFFRLGVSSVEIMSVANALEQQFGVRPSVGELMSYESFSPLLDYYDKNQAMVPTKENKIPLEEQRNYQVEALLSKCSEKGIFLWQEEGKLKYKAAQGKMDHELLLELKRQKESLLAYLKRGDEFHSQGRFPLTPIQLAYVLGREAIYDLGRVHSHYYMEFRTEAVDLKKMEAALNRVIKNNEALRTIIYSDATQEVMGKVPYYALESNSLADEKELAQLRKTWDHHQYPLETWPMFSVFLSELDQQQRLHLSLDCILLDGWSVRLFVEQLLKEYYDVPQAFSKSTFREYLHKEKTWLHQHRSLDRSAAYWNQRVLSLPPAPKLPYAKALSEIELPHYKRLAFELKEDEVALLRYKTKKHKLTLSLVVCACYMRALSHWTKEKEFTVNLTIFNRHPMEEDIELVLGDFTNITLLSYKEEKTLLETMEKLQEQLWTHIEYRSFDGVELLRKIKRNYPEEAVMPVVFTSMLRGDVRKEEDSYLDKVEGDYALSQTPQVVLDHQIHERKGELFFSWDYVEEAFLPSQMEEVFSAYQKEIHTLIHNSWEEL